LIKTERRKFIGLRMKSTLPPRRRERGGLAERRKEEKKRAKEPSPLPPRALRDLCASAVNRVDFT